MKHTSHIPRFYWLSSFPVLIVGFMAWLFWPVPESHSVETTVSSVSTADVARVEVLEVLSTDFALNAEATGALQAWREVEVGVQVAGKVVWRGVEEGQRVGQGSTLLRLEDSDRRIELAEAEADLLKVRATFAVSTVIDSDRPVASAPARFDTTGTGADEELLRLERLAAEGLVAEAELQRVRRRHNIERMLDGTSRDEVRAASLGLSQAEQRMARARLAADRTEVRAPFAGRVADIEVEVGQQITTGRKCMSLLDDSRLKVDVDVLEADVVWLRPQAPASVRVPALDDRVFSGSVLTINPKVDAETGTGRVSVVIDNPDGALMPGLFAFVSLETRRLEDRLVVPADAVLSRQGRQLVFRILDGRAHWTYVETGVRSGNSVEITDGLQIGDQVAVAGQFALAHEAPVEIAADGRSM